MAPVAEPNPRLPLGKDKRSEGVTGAETPLLVALSATGSATLPHWIGGVVTRTAVDADGWCGKMPQAK